MEFAGLGVQRNARFISEELPILKVQVYRGFLAVPEGIWGTSNRGRGVSFALRGFQVRFNLIARDSRSWLQSSPLFVIVAYLSPLCFVVVVAFFV